MAVIQGLSFCVIFLVMDMANGLSSIGFGGEGVYHHLHVNSTSQSHKVVSHWVRELQLVVAKGDPINKIVPGKPLTAEKQLRLNERNILHASYGQVSLIRISATLKLEVLGSSGARSRTSY